ncbi:hypothetical protein DSO57_1009688 [Entomophthora muscae]|uniref:Uncharacterized protein n=1 Tax=Entomophthora muscae TaxID=34485 RepID=A0ACC2THE7_9FUNG|nr:hypothetical protein DSO57_1009688 [Entomophthora muscae]
MCESVTTGFFENCLGLDVFYKIWEPREARANVLFVHGHGEHISRYDEVFAKFAKSGIKVLGFDQVGCGETGKRANDIGGVRGIEQLLHDITVAIAWIHKNGTPLFLMGHSFGGCAVLNYVARGEKRHFIHGAIASGTAAAQTNYKPQQSKLPRI